MYLITSRIKSVFSVGILGGILLVIILQIMSSNVFAQQDWDERIVQAEEVYYNGQFSKAEAILKECIKSGELSTEQQTKALRLLGLSYLSRELEAQAKEAVQNLLTIMPDYQPNPQLDPPQFIRLVEDMKNQQRPVEERGRSVAIPKVPRKGYFTLHGTISSPIGGFAKDGEVGQSGLVTSGLGGGVSYTLPIGTSRMNWVNSAMFISNYWAHSIRFLSHGIDKSVITQENLEGNYKINVTGARWTSLGILTGFKYEEPISASNDLYGIGQIGFAFVMPPITKIPYEDRLHSGTERLEFSSGNRFEFLIGGGVVINKRIDLSLIYLNMGELTLEGKYINEWKHISGNTGIDTEIITRKQKTSMVSLVAGYNL